MKVYLASRYSRREELRQYADELTARGHIVTARWLTGSHDLSDHPEPWERARLAREDLEDLCASDAVVSFTDEEGAATRGRGGRHVEFGLGLAMDKSLHIIGKREHVFHWLPEVAHWETWQQFIEAF